MPISLIRLLRGVPFAVACLQGGWATLCPAWESALFGPSWQATPALSFESDKILQDFSFAGYRRGESPLPVQPPGLTYNVVTGYGADPTGSTDSTVAIQNAINAASTAGGGIVWMPAGTYQIRPQGSDPYCLQISSSRVVLRGAGTGQTFLLNTETVMRSKNIISVTGPASAAWSTTTNPITNITTDLMGPVTQIPVASVAGFAVGDFIIVRADPGDAWATEHLEDGWVGHAGSFGRLMYLRQIMALDATNQIITIDIPTRYTLKMRDNARVYKKTTLITESGLEHFSIGNTQHPGTSGWAEEDYTVSGRSAYDVHNSYAIRMSRVRDGWIRNVKSYQPTGNTTTTHILNNGILLSECTRVTVRDCHFQRPQFGGGGGAGYMYRLQNSGDCLLQDSIAEFCRHGIVFSHIASSGNVIHACLDKTTGKQTGNTGNQNTSGRGSDHHMHFSHSNLLDTCVADDSWFEARYRPFGSVPLHNLTSAHGVYWNTEGRTSGRTYVVHSQQSRYGYVIGTRGAVSTVKTDGTSTTKTNPVDHVEGAGTGDSLTPFSLFREQRRRRLGLPTVAPMAEVPLLFPQNTATLSPVVRFGDSSVVPPDATLSWAQTTGPETADLQPIGASGLNVAFRMPGTHTLTLTVNRQGSLEDDWVTTAPVTVRVLPPGWQRVELLPVADAYVQLGNPTTNYNSTSLWMKNAGSGSTVNREIFMRFDLSSLVGRTVHEAFLQMQSIEPDIGATAQTHWVTDDTWTETGLTWNTKPAASLLLQTWPLAPDYLQRLDLSARTVTEADGDGLLSLRHSVVSQTDTDTVFKYASREATNVALRPRLSVLHSEVWPSFEQWIASFPQVPVEKRGTTVDADGDGRTNLEEYARRSLPHVADPLPTNLRAERTAGGDVRLVLAGGAGLPAGVYPLVDHSAALTGAGWQAVPRVSMTLSGADLVFTLPAPLAQARTGFFRLRFVLVSSE
jgi:hypothetical protein